MNDSIPSDWRTLGETEPDDSRRGPRESPAGRPSGALSQRSMVLMGLLVLGAGLLGIAGVVVVASRADPGEVVIGADRADVGSDLDPQGLLTESSAGSPGASVIVVDVEGAVQRPGLHRLSSGARLGEAIAAAGGFSVRVDAAAAARALNLAQPLQDGSKIAVPALGETDSPSDSNSDGASNGTGGGTLVDLNIADQALLETLPQIGPVTASAIIAAREEAAFSSVDDLRTREVVGPSTFEQIRALVTVGG